MALFRRRREDNPFEGRGRWFKGALHARLGGRSDTASVAKLAKAYAEKGFAFVFVTDAQLPPAPSPMVQGVLVLPGFEIALTPKGPAREFRLVGLGGAKKRGGEPASPVDLVRDAHDAGAYTILAHPYLSAVGAKEIASLNGLHAVEVYNRRADLLGRGTATYGLDWCLKAGKRLHLVAVDDADDPRNVGRAWVMVRAKSCEPRPVLDAIRGGMFYSSCGPEIFDVRVRRDRVAVKTSPCRLVRFFCDKLKGEHIAAPGGGTLREAEYLYRGGETVIRIECVDADGRTAWTNPLYF